jgi:hypothetical protein
VSLTEALKCLTVVETIQEFILDDFDDPAEVTEVSNGFQQHPVVTEHVGGLDAQREMAVFDSNTDLNDWSFDSNVRTRSALSLELDGHTPPAIGNTPTIVLDIAYSFSPVDLTEGGVNSALLFDFRTHQGTELPLFFRVFAFRATTTVFFLATATGLEFSDNPFTFAIPFSSFANRGGERATLADFSTLNGFGVEFFFFAPNEEIRWSV